MNITEEITTTEALHKLGADESTLTAAEKNFLDENGYLVLPGILDARQLAATRRRLAELLTEEGSKAGLEVHQERGTARLANLVNKGPEFQVAFTHPRVLAGIAHVLQNDMQLSSLNSRAALPGQGLQGLHADWHEAVGANDYQVCNSIWLLDDFTSENGATRVVPGSHRWGKMPGDMMSDASAPHPQEKLLLAPAGTVAIFNSHTWHGGTLNRTLAPRRAVHSYWCRRGQPQQLEQQKHLDAATRREFSPAVRHLLNVRPD